MAGFAFTMLGFLAAVITILFSASATKLYARYRNAGYLDTFFMLYYMTLVCLIITAGLAIMSLSSAAIAWGTKWLLVSFVNNLAQVAAITVIICNLARKSSQKAVLAAP